MVVNRGTVDGKEGGLGQAVGQGEISRNRWQHLVQREGLARLLQQHAQSNSLKKQNRKAGRKQGGQEPQQNRKAGKKFNKLLQGGQELLARAKSQGVN